MFSEFFETHPLEECLAGTATLPFPKYGAPFYRNLSEEDRLGILSLYEEVRATPYPMRLATDFLAFIRSGSRKQDENPYFFRRKKLIASVLALLLGHDTDAALSDVIDGIWCISEESSWVISAHNVNPVPGAPTQQDFPLPDPERPYVDLFSAQTAMVLSFTICLVGSLLDGVTPLLTHRVRREIERRVLEPFRTRDDMWWMGIVRKDLNNWSPWIVSNIFWTAAALELPREEYGSIVLKGLQILDRYLQVLPDDGGCDEGVGYWNMAGGALLDCLQLLEHQTGGRASFYLDEKIRNILSFPAKMEIRDGLFVNFADCDARPALSGERLLYAGEKLQDPALISLGLRTLGAIPGTLSDVPHFSRCMLRLCCTRPLGTVSPVPAHSRDVYLPDLQVRLVHRGGLTLACKGGHNGENHNHNDVGSFMLYVDGVGQVVDAGNMTYTAKTFSSQRYELWNTQSCYHNVPRIGHTDQRDGREFSAQDVACLPDGLSLSMEKAYPEKSLLSFRRVLHLSAQELTVTDEITLSEPLPVSWFFLLREKPDVKMDGSVNSGSIRLRFSEGDVSLDTEEIPVVDPRMMKSYPGALYRLKVTRSPERKHRMTFTFSREQTDCTEGATP